MSNLGLCTFFVAVGCAAAKISSAAPIAKPVAPPAHEPGEPDGPITAADRDAVVEALATTLAHDYVFADKAARLGAALREHVHHGDYANIVTALAFARRITEDMAALVHDKHLVVEYSDTPIEPFTDQLPPDLAAEERADQEYQNGGIFEVRRMRFNLGYVNFAAFGRVSAMSEKLAAAMRLVHDTQTLIVDLRGCHGGDPDMVTQAESYLVAPNTHLLDMYTRASNVTEHVYAKADPGAPRYALDKPVFVLISDQTASGCEAFAYAMQAQKRATVIGSHSAGAAYFGDPHRLTAHFMANIPIGRPIDPITHGDWEGTGVVPAVVIDPSKALDVAERKSLEVLQPHEKLPRRKADMLKRIAELK